MNLKNLKLEHPREYLIKFLTESNHIENIFSAPNCHEVDEFVRFLALDVITIEDLQKFVSVFQPDAVLRDKYHLNVRVGSYYPPRGGPEIRDGLKNLLSQDYDAYKLHIAYEKLHPFTDCNGRSGRALWAWKYINIAKGFLIPFYFETLKNN